MTECNDCSRGHARRHVRQTWLVIASLRSVSISGNILDISPAPDLPRTGTPLTPRHTIAITSPIHRRVRRPPISCSTCIFIQALQPRLFWVVVLAGAQLQLLVPHLSLYCTTLGARRRDRIRRLFSFPYSVACLTNIVVRDSMYAVDLHLSTTRLNISPARRHHISGTSPTPRCTIANTSPIHRRVRRQPISC